MKKYIDVTLTITNEMATWPGDPNVLLERVSKIEEGANANVSRIVMGVHTGTHVDAPVHFIPGAGTIEDLTLDSLIGMVQVVRVPDSVDVITADVIEGLPIQTGIERLLFKTRNSRIWEQSLEGFQTDFVGISEDGAEYLVNLGVKLVGIDYLSIAPYKNSRPTHRVLLNAGVVALEGVNLSNVQSGDYELICLPMKLGGSDGAPARVILVQEM